MDLHRVRQCAGILLLVLLSISVLVERPNTSFAQTGHNAVVIRDTPEDYVKKDMLLKIKAGGATILGEGADSIRLTFKGTTAIYYFQQDGSDTRMSLKNCLGDDCTKENTFDAATESIILNGLQHSAAVIEEDYKAVQSREKTMEIWKNGAANASKLQRPIVLVGSSKVVLDSEMNAAKTARPELHVDSLVEGRIKPRVTGYSMYPVKRFGVDGTMVAGINSGDHVYSAIWKATKMSMDDYKEVARQLTEEVLGPGKQSWQYETDHDSGWQGYTWMLGKGFSMLQYDRHTQELTYITQLGSGQ